jgi:CMP-N-acetylneuraminic acid synthetase
MNIAAFMPIRLNSKRVAGKSVRKLGGRPLFCWALQELDQLGIPVHIYCSSPETIQPLVDFSAKNVCFTKRPEALDGDDVKGIEIYRKFAEQVQSDAYLLTHCTSPFMKAATYSKVVSAVDSGEVQCALTVRRVQTFTWFDERPLNFSLPRIQTQKLRPVWVETSAAYGYLHDVLLAGDRSDLNPKLVEVSWPEDEDIDTEIDFARCESMAALLREEAQKSGVL